MITQNDLKLAFDAATVNGDRFVGLKIQMSGFEKDEIIINERENFQAKLEYYQRVYDEDLNHKFSQGIKILGITSANSFDEIQADLID
ncbi:hypothetical protein [Paenibacillus naphthalenovorans]|uniref:Uncharacterized protein n=1 Tax=Paenibacillus naphthalenovorans TaxID=162209 RepID=A0A0U2UJL9_9BACL|nr:hypothetical protein [Paenibacillus naphthalenovorans]ALS22113.1 hypothetical protein IJ22_17390 [Paenibacillus naphthalenovorans]